MARIRSIKPEFPQSETIGKLSREARLLFIQLWTIVDDEGKARASSRVLASVLYPFDDDAKELIEGWLGELERHSCVELYEVENNRYVQITNWLKHQKIDRPSKSRLPDPREGSRVFIEASMLDLGSRIMDLGSRNNKHARERASVSKNRFDEFWSEWPNKVGKPVAKKSYDKVSDCHEAIMAGLQRYIQNKPPERPWLNPSTFLNQRRWEDVPAEIQPQTAKPVEKGGFASLMARQLGLKENGREEIGAVQIIPLVPISERDERGNGGSDNRGISGNSPELLSGNYYRRM